MKISSLQKARYEYSPKLPGHMEKELPFPAQISHSTDRLHSAYGLYPTASCLSEGIEEYRGDLHPLYTYSEYR